MKILCIGRNYVDHIEELNNEIPDHPLIFMKPSTALWQGEEWPMPDFSKDIHYECEWVLRISKKAKAVNQSSAKAYIDAMTLGIDFTARDHQALLKQNRHPWELSKAFDGAALVGDWLSFDPKLNSFSFYKGEKLLQKGAPKLMMFKWDYLVSYCSKYFTLEPGDLLFTGTPSGVGKVQIGAEYSAQMMGRQVLHFKVIRP